MNEMTVHSQNARSDRFVSALLIALTFIGLYSKWSVSYHQAFNSDHVQHALYFYDIVQSHNWYLKDWHLTPNALLLSDFPLFFIAGLAFGMNILTLKIVSFLIYALSIGLASLVVYRMYGVTASFWTAAYLSCGPSPLATYLIVQPTCHNGTVNLSLLSLLIVLALIRSDSPTDGLRRRSMTRGGYYFALFLLSLLWVFSDPYYIFIFVIPLGASLAMLPLLRVEFIGIRKAVALIALLLTSSLMGLGFQHILGAFDLHIEKLGAGIASPLRMLQNLSLYVRIIAHLFDMNLLDGQPSLSSLLLRMANLFLMIGVVACVVSVWKSETRPAGRFVQLFFFSLSLFLSLAFITSTRAYDMGHARYLTPMLYSFSFFFALAIDRNRHILRPLYRHIMIFLFLVVSLAHTHAALEVRQDQPHARLSEFLEREGLHYGYSGYWHANIVTALSQDRVRVRAVQYEGVSLKPFLFLSRSDWYDPTFHEGKTFLMVPQRGTTVQAEDSLAGLTDTRIAELLGQPERRLSFENMHIYVWPYNIMQIAAGKHHAESTGERSVRIPQETLRLIGSLESTPEGNILHSRKGERGHLVYGPYWPLKEGTYRVRFHLIVTGDPESVIANLDVNVMDRKRGVPAEQPITKEIRGVREPKPQEHSLEFTAHANARGELLYEFRVFSTGSGDVMVKGITLEKL